METKHTSGPWGIAKSHKDSTIAIRLDGDDNEQCIAEALVIDCKDEAKANARLIAAAPELLECLEGLMYLGERMEEESGETDPFIEKCRKVIKKATNK